MNGIDYKSLPFRPPETALGSPPAAWSSPVLVLNTNSAQATADIDDPYDSLPSSGTSPTPDTYHANVVPIEIPHGAALAYIWAMHYGNTAVTLSTPGVVRCFGRVPFPGGKNPNSGGLARCGPSLWSSNFPNLLGYPSGHEHAGIYLPAVEVGYTRGTPGITLDRIALRHEYSGSKDLMVTEPRLISIAGFDRLVALVATASVLSATDSGDANLVCVRFVI